MDGSFTNSDLYYRSERLSFLSAKPFPTKSIFSVFVNDPHHLKSQNLTSMTEIESKLTSIVESGTLNNSWLCTAGFHSQSQPKMSRDCVFPTVCLPIDALLRTENTFPSVQFPGPSAQRVPDEHLLGDHNPSADSWWPASCIRSTEVVFQHCYHSLSTDYHIPREPRKYITLSQNNTQLTRVKGWKNGLKKRATLWLIKTIHVKPFLDLSRVIPNCDFQSLC